MKFEIIKHPKIITTPHFKRYEDVENPDGFSLYLNDERIFVSKEIKPLLKIIEELLNITYGKIKDKDK